MESLVWLAWKSSNDARIPVTAIKATVPSLTRRPISQTRPRKRLLTNSTSDLTIPKVAVAPARTYTLPFTTSPSRNAKIAWLPKSTIVAPTDAPRSADLRFAYLTPVSNLEFDKSSTISPRTSRSIVRTSVREKPGTSGWGPGIFTVGSVVEPMTWYG